MGWIQAKVSLTTTFENCRTSKEGLKSTERKCYHYFPRLSWPLCLWHIFCHLWFEKLFSFNCTHFWVFLLITESCLLDVSNHAWRTALLSCLSQSWAEQLRGRRQSFGSNVYKFPNENVWMSGAEELNANPFCCSWGLGKCVATEFQMLEQYLLLTWPIQNLNTLISSKIIFKI
jgi:hypothetical protein